MSKRGHYLGGHTLIRVFLRPQRGAAVGVRRPKLRALDGAEFSARASQEAEHALAEKAALRRFFVSDDDRRRLGFGRPNWSYFQDQMIAALQVYTKSGIHRADQLSSALNKRGLKTPGGEFWTPRLIKVFKAISLNDSRGA